MQGLNSSVITVHVVLNVQGPLGNRDGEQDNETCSTRRLSTSGRTLKKITFSIHKISMTITYYNNNNSNCQSCDGLLKCDSVIF